MKAEDWQAYQARQGGDSQVSSGTSCPPPHIVARPKRAGMGWPMAVLLFGLALIGGCLYTFSGLTESVDTTTGPSVGVLVIEDEISGSIWVTNALDSFQENDDIKSIVIRINSPGGAVAPCQEIYNAVKKIDKPVVISMGSVAASGGVYIAVAGDVIMANPGTITGSIGVIMQVVEVSGTMDKLGLKSETIKSGKFKDMGSPFRQMDPSDREILQNMVSEVYEQFVADVAAGRPKLKLDKVRRLADGRIYTGSEALKLGLVDELGGFEDALTKAALLGGMSGEERPNLVIHDGRQPWWEAAMTSKLNLSIGIPPALQPGLSFKYMYQPDFSIGQ